MTLREQVQAQINAKQVEIDALKAQLSTKDPQIAALLNADPASLVVFFKTFKDALGL